MTDKGRARAARKAARARGENWNLERGQDGGLEVVRERTPPEERAHERRMERWARRMADRD
jgi:hypothetical protein